jgi:hypothetical protein
MSAWIAHVKKYRSEHPGLSYGECLTAARPSYRSQRGSGLLQKAHEFVKKHKLVSKAGHLAAKHLGGQHAGTIHKLASVAGDMGYGAPRRRRRRS